MPSEPAAPPPATSLLTALAMVGFAANSLLARGAIGARTIDPATYTLVRLGSGALMLAALVWLRPRARAGAVEGTWIGGAALAAYAGAFSFAYVRIGAALGALVLFPTVKLALLGWGLARGERPPRHERLGAMLALAGLGALTWPGAGHGNLVGVLLMVCAGLAWAVYTVQGRTVRSPTAATATNFALSLPFALVLAPAAWTTGHATPRGLALSAASGALASGLAYSLWYAAVPRLTALQMGLAQLAVPALATLGAVALLGEHLTLRVVVAATTIFVGVGMAMWRR